MDFNPNSVIANVISFTDPNLFLMDLIILCVEELSPSKYNTVSTMCSSILGPAIAPSFVT